MNIYEAREFLHRLQDEYAGRIDDGESSEDAMGNTLGDVCDNGLLLKLILASGCTAEAFNAVSGRVEDAIRDRRRDYAY